MLLATVEVNSLVEVGCSKLIASFRDARESAFVLHAEICENKHMGSAVSDISRVGTQASSRCRATRGLYRWQKFVMRAERQRWEHITKKREVWWDDCAANLITCCRCDLIY